MDNVATTDRERRNEILRKVMRNVALKNKAKELPVCLKDGTRPIVVALEHDLLSEVMHRVQASGGDANVFVQMDDGNIALASVYLASGRSRRVRKAESLGPQPVHSDIEVGMFVAVCLQYEEGVECAIRLPHQSADVRSVETVQSA